MNGMFKIKTDSTVLRYAIFLLLVFLMTVSYAFKVDFRLTGYLTYDMNAGNIDNFPIVYWTITPPAPLDSFAIKLTDYLTYTHGTFKLLDYNLIIPRYYFVDTRMNFNTDYVRTLYLAFGRMRLSRGLTSKYESVQLGGLRFDTYNTSVTEPGLGGLAGYISGTVADYSYELGGAYSLELNKYALYGTLTTQFGSFGVYYENRYYQLSLNYSNSQKFSFGTLDYWAGVGAATNTLNEPSFLVGTRLSSGPWFGAAQFAWIGGNKYDVSFATGEPSNPNVPRSWNVMGEIGYNLPGMYIGLFAKYNSSWASSGWLPLYGVKLNVADLSISLANGDLYASTSLPTTQFALLKLTYTYQTSVDLMSTFQSVVSSLMPKPAVEQKEEKQPAIKIADLYKMPEGAKVTVSGTVLAPVGLLSGSTTYIQDETAAIMLYGRSIPTSLNVGDVVLVSGSTKVYNGILEIIVDSVTVVGKAAVKPVVLEELSDRYLSNLVTVEGVVESVAKDNFILDTGKFKVKIYIKSATGISLAQISEGKTVKVTGILTLFRNELEIQPRSQDDIVVK